MKTQAMKIYFHKVLKVYHTEEKFTYSEEMGSGSLEIHFIELKRYEVKKKRRRRRNEKRKQVAASCCFFSCYTQGMKDSSN